MFDKVLNVVVALVSAGLALAIARGGTEDTGNAVIVLIVAVLAALAIYLLGTAARPKRCPDCAERVRKEARVCRYCGHRFADPPGA